MRLRRSEPKIKPVPLPDEVPQSDYTPYGYIDNPFHSAVLSPRGVFRCVPPLGFGFWCRQLPWPYGGGLAFRQLNYLSLMHISCFVDGLRLHTTQDFIDNGVALVSRYHTKNTMSYDFEYNGLSFGFRHFLSEEDSLACLVEIHNTCAAARELTIHATNIYGYPERGWWGSDGIVSKYDEQSDTAISKMWAYGDVFALGSTKPSCSHKATSSEDEWVRWITQNDLTSNGVVSVKGPGPLFTVMSYQLEVRPRETRTMVLALSRDTNEEWAIDRHRRSIAASVGNLKRRLAEDSEFYSKTARLTGDWPSKWKHGWIYDMETLRMTIRPPLGIFKHPWDGMQIYTPRQVLGETMIDCMALSYADIELAKEVIYGTFVDSPAANIPCSREDGSVNMISADGAECGTSPTWGMPFKVIRLLYMRDGDDRWIAQLYPHLKAFLEWWLKNRTDREGWFHSKCSWESGQDGSKRFLIDCDDPGAVSDYVRTVDIEAAMADAMKTMVNLARIAGRPEDAEYWSRLAEKRIASVRAMFVDGEFRDVDARNGKPIILENYHDVMMTFPFAVGIASEEQFEQGKWIFQYFRQNPTHWLEWPSFLWPFTEGAWAAGLRQFVADLVADTADRVYARSDGRETKPTGHRSAGFPEPYNYRIPGVANEFWPLREDNPGGCECYGWGATMPTLIVRNIIGFREIEDTDAARDESFVLAPAIPTRLAIPGKVYGIDNIRFRGTRVDVRYEVFDGGDLLLDVALTSASSRSVTVRDSLGGIVASGSVNGERIRFAGRSCEVYTVSLA